MAETPRPRKEPTLEARNEIDHGFREALFAIEPDVRRLTTVMTDLTILATAQDTIEPVALIVLAEVGVEAVEQISTNWCRVLHHSQRSLFGSGLAE